MFSPAFSRFSVSVPPGSTAKNRNSTNRNTIPNHFSDIPGAGLGPTGSVIESAWCNFLHLSGLLPTIASLYRNDRLNNSENWMNRVDWGTGSSEVQKKKKKERFEQFATVNAN
jgi:hypothetical protein